MRLDGSQIKPEGPGIFAAEVKRWHVWMVDHQTIPQAIHEIVKINTATKLAKWWGSGVRAFVPAADGMATCTQALGQSATLLFHRAKRDLLGKNGRCPEQQRDNCKAI